MATEQDTRTADKKGEKDPPADKKSGRPPAKYWRRWGVPVGLSALMIGTVVAHGFLLALHRTEASTIGRAAEEIPLGQFRFIALRGTPAGTGGATFQLHVRFLDEIRPLAQMRLAARRFKVQQDIEVLLRQASANDFADPALVGLKRQLQEQINKSLAMRAVADVIVTQLTLDRLPARAPAATAVPAQAAPPATPSASAPAR